MENATSVTGFIPDRRRPSLTDFILDRDSGIVALQFSEVVNLESLDPTQIRLQSRRNVNDGPTESFFLSAMTEPVSSAISDLIELRLSVEQLMLFETGFGDAPENTFVALSFSPSMISTAILLSR